jgi:hypothetical protein
MARKLRSRKVNRSGKDLHLLFNDWNVVASSAVDKRLRICDDGNRRKLLKELS